MHHQIISTRIVELPVGPAEYGQAVPVRVLEKPGAMNLEYLQSISEVLSKSLAENKRVSVFRFDLRLPDCIDDRSFQNYHISRFINALNARLKALHKKKLRENRRTYEPCLRFAWARERHTSSLPHYHFFITLNKDAYHAFGNIAYTNLSIKQNNSHPSLYGMVVSAWASVLGIPPKSAIGLVHIPKNSVYYLNALSEDYMVQYQDVMQRLSYLAKEDTKGLDKGVRNFGTSRR